MKKVIFFLCLATTFPLECYSQFKSVAGGFARSAVTTISSSGFRLAGGGVVLKGIAYSNNLSNDFNFVDYSVNNNNSTSLYFSVNGCNISLSSQDWIIKDAIELVNSEVSNHLVRDVSLFGLPQFDEDTLKYPVEDFWYVEMNNSLIGTKTGEILLLVDLLQTDITYYSDSENYTLDSLNYSNAFDALIYESVNHSFDNIQIFNDKSHQTSFSQLDSIRFRFLNELINELELTSSEELFSLLELNIYPYLSNYIYSLHTPSNWTYNDEYTHYNLIADCNSNELLIYGQPNFTFLTLENEDELFSSYFEDNFSLIYNLRPSIFDDAKEFSQIAAFLRFLKKEKYSEWQELYTNHGSYQIYNSTNSPNFTGRTPRIILK